MRATRHPRRTEQDGRVDDCDGAKGIGLRAVDVVGDATVLFCPARLEGNSVLLEVVDHVQDAGKEKVLYAAARGIDHNT